MVLDQQDDSPKKITVSGNNQLLKGSIFALITLVWFSFMFAFINMNWAKFNPIIVFLGTKDKECFIFYFIAFSFFVSSLIFSLIFYKNNLQPADILIRFGIIIIYFTLVFLGYLLFSTGFFVHKNLFVGGLSFFSTPSFIFDLGNVLLTFLLFYMLFYPIILVFSRLFFNGFFGQAGFILCFFITAVFHVAIYLLAGLERKLGHTSFPLDDIVVILFFTLVAFGIGVVAGEEAKKKKPQKRTLNSLS